jgi:Uma2 family endonuclease
MSRLLEANACTATPHRTVADLVRALGGIPLERIRLQPAPGTATEEDVVREKLCELIDGTLVEKAMGNFESMIGAALLGMIWQHAKNRDLGIVSGADSMYRFLDGKVRQPDVAFIRWERVGNQVPTDAVGDVVPDLAVEIVSAGNTAAEIAQKVQDYLSAGVGLVWVIDPARRRAEIWRTPEDCTSIDEQGTLDGGEVLPGFSLKLEELFSRTKRR